MLRTLAIRDIVLVDRLEIGFQPSLCVLTGETGAGKSILLDALGLALGARGESRLVRQGAEQAVVSAEFVLGAETDVRRLLADYGLAAADETVILRRILGADGRSRAFVNEQPVSVALLRQIGEGLVDVHGQFENQRLLDGRTHRALLDAYGGHGDALEACRRAYRAWRGAERLRAEAEAARDQARRDEEFLRHAAAELESLAPRPGEEADLAAKRAAMMHREKLVDAVKQAAADLAEGRGVGACLRAASRGIARAAPLAAGGLDAVAAALERAALEAEEADAQLERAGAAIDLDPRQLEAVEDRLFALRAAARKYGAAPDALPEIEARFRARLGVLEDGEASLERLRRAEGEARAAFVADAEALRQARRRAATRLDAAVATELKPLRLGAARFATRIAPVEQSAWGEDGCDRVTFEVATIPGAPPGPLARISSGGELARFMLALKVVLARADPVPTIVFDEVDSGVGGAVAAAVGERLARLAGDFQVLVVTHSPQVAARAAHHWRVTRRERTGEALTAVEPLSAAGRREEIARMLAGASVTDEARAAAGRLLEGRRP